MAAAAAESACAVLEATDARDSAQLRRRRETRARLLEADRRARKYASIQVDVRGGYRTLREPDELMRTRNLHPVQLRDGEWTYEPCVIDNSDESVTDGHRALRARIEAMCARYTHSPTCIRWVRVCADESPHGSVAHAWITIVPAAVVLTVVETAVRGISEARPWLSYACSSRNAGLCRGHKTNIAIDTAECAVPKMVASGVDLFVLFKCESDRIWSVHVLGMPISVERGERVTGMQWFDTRNRKMDNTILHARGDLHTLQSRAVHHTVFRNPAQFPGVARFEGLRALANRFARVGAANMDLAPLARIIESYACAYITLDMAVAEDDSCAERRAALDAQYDRDPDSFARRWP